MIRLLTEQDRQRTVEFLAAAPEYNLYTLGNIERLGFAHELTQYWGDFAADGSLRGVLNRYMQGWVVFGTEACDWAAFGQIVDAHPVAAQRLQDNPGGIATFLPYLRRYEPARVSIQHLMALDAADFAAAAPQPDALVRRATMTDLPRLVAFYAKAGHMTRAEAAVEQPLQSTRIWLAEVGGEILSAALTNAETADLAMIGGVYTKPEARQHGLSRAVCSALCRELLQLGRRPVLYWETPAAGAVYQRLGFHVVGEWRSVRLKAR
ncbi:MAG: GNAT family N-acetyltransferase [Caldilineaceae bacterium]